MKLTVTNIAKIKEASIEFNGITVIAGENNSGKSTISKTLFSIYYSFYNSSSKLAYERKHEIGKRIGHFFGQHNLPNLHPIKSMTQKINEMPSTSTVEEIHKTVLDELGDQETDLSIFDDTEVARHFKVMDEKSIKELASNLHEILTINEDFFQQRLISRHFKNEFNSQINHIDLSNTCNIQLTDKDKNIHISFQNNECIRFSKDYNINEEALYIDTPFILDDLDDNGHFFEDEIRSFGRKSHRDLLLRKLLLKSDITLIDEILKEKKLGSIIQKINEAAYGDFTDSISKIGFRENGFSASFNVSNLSTGLKTFAILKRLLENGHLEKGVLILDEPEVHLHPKWQLIFAEILVLLQKEFDLTVLLTTHSPYFLESIEVYSQKHGVFDKCKFYLTELNGNYATITDVGGDDLEKIYKKLAEPFKELEIVRDTLHG